MSIKEDDKYKNFIIWLNNRLKLNQINKGQYELMKMSESLFLEYCIRYNTQPKFKQSQDRLYKIINRDLIIKGILSDDGFK